MAPPRQRRIAAAGAGEEETLVARAVLPHLRGEQESTSPPRSTSMWGKLASLPLFLVLLTTTATRSAQAFSFQSIHAAGGGNGGAGGAGAGGVGAGSAVLPLAWSSTGAGGLVLGEFTGPAGSSSSSGKEEGVLVRGHAAGRSRMVGTGGKWLRQSTTRGGLMNQLIPARFRGEAEELFSLSSSSSSSSSSSVADLLVSTMLLAGLGGGDEAAAAAAGGVPPSFLMPAGGMSSGYFHLHEDFGPSKDDEEEEVEDNEEEEGQEQRQQQDEGRIGTALLDEGEALYSSRRSSPDTEHLLQASSFPSITEQPSFPPSLDNPPPPPPPPRNDNFTINLGKALDHLRVDVPLLFDREPDMSIYTEDVRLRDDVRVYATGKFMYQMVYFSLRLARVFMPMPPLVEVLNIRWCPARQCIEVRFQIRVDTLSDQLYFDAVSVYKVNAQGLIYEHLIEKVIRNDLSEKPSIVSLFYNVRQILVGGNTPIPDSVGM